MLRKCPRSCAENKVGDGLAGAKPVNNLLIAARVECR